MLRLTRTPSILSNVISSTTGGVTFTIEDDEPTILNLAHTGSNGGIKEGEVIEFAITIGRELIAKEIIDVPLTVSSSIMTADWSLLINSVAASVPALFSWIQPPSHPSCDSLEPAQKPPFSYSLLPLITFPRPEAPKPHPRTRAK